MSQASLAGAVGISVSYLSQIESDDRPMTAPVLAAFARVFPDHWADLDDGAGARLLVRAAIAAEDSEVPGPKIPPDALQRAVARHPALTERLVAVHDAYQQAREQLRTLDDALDTGTARGTPLPWDEIRDWFHEQGNYIDIIDRAAEDAAAQVRGIEAASVTERLADLHGVTVVRDVDRGTGSALRRFDPADRTLTINRSLPPESQLFLLAHQLMRLELLPLIEIVVEKADVRSAEARRLLSVGLSNYAAGAFLMPYSRFRSAAQAVRHDIDALRQVFGVSFEQACHRLSTLQRPGSQGLPIFFCRVDMAGNITKRHSATRLQFARYGGACPLWIVHEAVAIPDRIVVQLAEMPDGVRYVSMAKGLVKPSSSYSRLSRRYAVAVGCEVSDASQFIYADQLDLGGIGSATPIGVSCRICARPQCEQRAFPPAGYQLSVDPDIRNVVPYSLL